MYNIYFWQDQVGMMARTIKATVGKTNLKDKMKSTTNLLSRLRHVAQVSNFIINIILVETF